MRALRTKNQNREEKVKEVKAIRHLYPDLDRKEQMFMVISTLGDRALKTEDHTKQASYTELGRAFEPLFDSGPLPYLVAQCRRLISQVRRDRGHPHIRPYCRPYVETLYDGTEVVREYVEILAGKEAIRKANQRLERLIIGGKEAIKANNELFNVRRVRKEVDGYRVELEQKQQIANSRKRKRGTAAATPIGAA